MDIKKKIMHISKKQKKINGDRELFTDNAFFLWEHRERILSDRRMALCPLHIGNNLAYVYIKGIVCTTLGGYLTWWKEFERSRRTDKRHRHSLIYFIGGSPLSGRNHCGEVYESGKTKTITVTSFKDYWKSFAETQERVSATDDGTQTYTLTKILDILRQEDRETETEKEIGLGNRLNNHDNKPTKGRGRFWAWLYNKMQNG